jgi:hypothetical protein
MIARTRDDQRARLNAAITDIHAHDWELVWRRGDDLLLRKHVLPGGVTLDHWECVRRRLGLARRDYQRWWIAADGELRSCRSDHAGRVLSKTRRPL